MEWYFWLLILLGAVLFTAVATAWITIKCCEFRYYDSPICYWELPKDRLFFIRGVSANESGDTYAMVQDEQESETHFVLLSSDLNLRELQVSGN